MVKYEGPKHTSVFCPETCCVAPGVKLSLSSCLGLKARDAPLNMTTALGYTLLQVFQPQITQLLTEADVGMSVTALSLVNHQFVWLTGSVKLTLSQVDPTLCDTSCCGETRITLQ